MAQLHEYKKEDYGTLLAAKVMDASKGTLFSATGLDPETTNRTILIGLGGTGVRTIDYVKGAIAKRLKPEWTRYVAFLGIDASKTEFDQASYLDPNEQIMITDSGVDQRMAQPETYPAAVVPFMPQGVQLSNLSSDGAGRTRLAGKIKIHDQVSGSKGFDERVVSKLQTLVGRDLTPLTSAIGKYEVYVIGSVSGGTCSGTFLELPALIRKAIPDRVRINAMLYLPDTLELLDPENASQLKANGYASLKELNYFMGMYMRGKDYAETWTYSDLAEPRLAYASQLGEEQFIDVPYLVGTTNGPSDKAAETAMKTISEFLISLLAKISSPTGAVFLTTAFASNALASAKISGKNYAPGSDQLEAANEYHEFPKRYAAIGFAEASVPKKMVRAYSIGEACRKAGLRPVSRDEYNSMAAANAPMLPFRGEDHLQNAQEGTAAAKDLLTPILNVHKALINNGKFSFTASIDQDCNWSRIRANEFETQGIANRVNGMVAQQTEPAALEAMEKELKKAYAEYRNNVKEYVRKHGPYAFVNLFHGRFVPMGDDHGIGIHRMIKNLVEGKTADGHAHPTKAVQDAYNNLQEAKKTVVNTPLVSLKHDRVAADWVMAYNAWVNARINAARREAALGPVGKLSTVFGMPAESLAREVEAFGRVLDMLTGIYQNLGGDMQSYQDFQQARDSQTEINLAAVNSASYNWLKDQADNAVANVNGEELRDRLVEDFFGYDSHGEAKSAKWLEIPRNCVRNNSLGKVELVNAEVAVPAREQFDKIVAEELPDTIDVSVEEMFEQLKEAGQDYDQTAHSVMKALEAQSKPLFHGKIPANSTQAYVMYPSSLENSDGNGSQIAAAIRSAAGDGVQVYASDDANGIMYYQMAAPMEIYRLSKLEDWEKQYEDGGYGIKQKMTYLHSLAPNTVQIQDPKDELKVKYEETIPWKRYPAITGRTYAQLPQELKDLVNKARAMGVLYSEQTPDGWIVKRANCTDWSFDITQCSGDPATGLLPTGRTLLDDVAAQNGTTLADVSRPVQLVTGGVMEKGIKVEDKAWEYAARVLYVHVPMYIEVLKTVETLEPWITAVEDYNRVFIKQLQPAKLVWLVRSQIVNQTPDGKWVYEDANGTKKILANITPQMLQMMMPKDRYMVTNGLLGYYLYGKLTNEKNGPLKDSKAFDEALQRAKNVWNSWLEDGDMDMMQAGLDRAQVLLDERTALEEKGARLDGDPAAKARSNFINALGLLQNEAVDIDLFYFRLGLWENV